MNIGDSNNPLREILSSLANILGGLGGRNGPTIYTKKVGGRSWTVHNNDSDPWPNRIHLVNEEDGEKLDPNTGNIYDIVTRKLKRKMSKKHLRGIQSFLKENKSL